MASPSPAQPGLQPQKNLPTPLWKQGNPGPKAESPENIAPSPHSPGTIGSKDKKDFLNRTQKASAIKEKTDNPKTLKLETSDPPKNEEHRKTSHITGGAIPPGHTSLSLPWRGNQPGA